MYTDTNKERKMTNAKCKIKTGMGGSRNGKSRWTGTEELKAQSKKQRRSLDKGLTQHDIDNLVDMMYIETHKG